jgi:symplekin
LSTVQTTQLDPNTAPLGVGVDDDDDDYEPDFQAAEDTEQILNKLDNAPPEDPPAGQTEVALGSFKLPPPPPLTEDQVTEMGQSTVARIFGFMQALDEPASKKNKAGINRLAASTYDRDAWITVMTRLATRASAGLDGTHDIGKTESDSIMSTKHMTISDTIRESLYQYVIEDFRKRIDVAVQWLCEEWYSEKIQSKYGRDAGYHYDKWALRVLDGVLPYLDARDKFLTRFLSEIPSLSAEMLERVKGLCRDPAMVKLALTSLLYLVIMRPPVREIALDAVEDVWRTCKFEVINQCTVLTTPQMMMQRTWQHNISQSTARVSWNGLMI